MIFSVITICWNDFENLKKTHQSLYSQSSSNFEWIVIDGESSDGAVEWLRELTIDNLKWISEKDNGIFDAMNKGLDIATGDFLIFMNSGDCFASNTILAEIEKIITEDVYFIYGDSVDVTLENGELYRKAKHYKKLYKGMFTQHQAMFFKKTVIKNQKYRTGYPITADYAFVAEFLNKCTNQNIKYFKKPICKFQLGGTNETHRFRALKEDYAIRRNIMKQNNITAMGLFILHLIHTYLKRTLPGVARKLRYK